jgi:membrane protein
MSGRSLDAAVRAWLKRIPGVAPVHRAVSGAARSVWVRDRAPLRGPRALAVRAFRIAILVVRGIVVHRLALLAAALTFFTVFSIIPMLVVGLWALKVFDHLPVINAELPDSTQILSGNQLLHGALREVLDSVRHASQVTGIVGLVTLLYVATKMFSFTERAMHTIAGSGQQTPRFTRALGYVALLLMVPAVLAVSGVLLAAVRQPLGNRIYQTLGAIPGFEIALAVTLVLGLLWLAATIFYWSAVRARIPFGSAAVGGMVAALALPVVFWAYANLQIGVSKAGVVGGGFAAFPVFLLWVFSSWYTLLICAEIAVAHHIDVVLVHGARAFHLDLDGERQASAAIVLRAARLARSGGGAAAPLSDDDLARELRLPPQLVRDLCVRLVNRGLLVEQRGGGGFSLRPDPDQTAFAAVIDAVERDPALEDVRREAADGFPPGARAALSARAGAAVNGGGPTLGQLADERPPG